VAATTPAYQPFRLQGADTAPYASTPHTDRPVAFGVATGPVLERVSRLEQRIDDLEKRLDRLERGGPNRAFGETRPQPK
jgi:hypothetical protein